jgi:hypothetical protein
LSTEGVAFRKSTAARGQATLDRITKSATHHLVLGGYCGDRSTSRIKQRSDWIRGHYEKMLRVEELAAIATMSVTSFHRHFRAGDLDDADPVSEADRPVRGSVAARR